MSLPGIIERYIASLKDTDSVVLTPLTVEDELYRAINENPESAGGWEVKKYRKPDKMRHLPDQAWLIPPDQNQFDELIANLERCFGDTSSQGLINLAAFSLRISHDDEAIRDVLRKIPAERWRSALEMFATEAAALLKEKNAGEILSFNGWHDEIMAAQYEIGETSGLYSLSETMVSNAGTHALSPELERLPKSLRAFLCEAYGLYPKTEAAIVPLMKNKSIKGLIANFAMHERSLATEAVARELLSEDDWNIVGAPLVQLLFAREMSKNQFNRRHNGSDNLFFDKIEAEIKRILLSEDRNWSDWLNAFDWPVGIEVMTVIYEDLNDTLIGKFAGPALDIFLMKLAERKNYIVRYEALNDEKTGHKFFWFLDPLATRSQSAITILSMFVASEWERTKNPIKETLYWCRRHLVSPAAAFHAARLGEEIILLLLLALRFDSKEPVLCRKQMEMERMISDIIMPFIGYWEEQDKPWDGVIALAQNKNLALIDWHMKELRKSDKAASLRERWEEAATAVWPWMVFETVEI